MDEILSVGLFAKVLICIVLLATCVGLAGVWFPELWSSTTGYRLILTFVVVSVGITVATGIFQYLK